MKISIGATLGLALALTLSACGDDSASNNAGNAAGNGSAGAGAQLTRIPAPNNGDWTQVVATTPEGGIRMGNPDAPTKLVEFGSMTCSHCAEFSHAASERLRSHYVASGQVSFEFRHFVRDGADAAAATLARCMPPAAFFRVTEDLFASQQEWLGKIDSAEQQQLQSLPQGAQLGAMARAAELDAFFRTRGLPQARIDQCLADQAALDRLAQNTQRDAERYRIPGTPAFLINDELVPNASAWEALEPALRAQVGS
jgi:protein-disulfide isomerase